MNHPKGDSCSGRRVLELVPPLQCGARAKQAKRVDALCGGAKPKIGGSTSMRRGRPTILLPAKKITLTEPTSILIGSAETAEDERDRIFRWRCAELRRAGYGIRDALLLAVNNEIDLHLAVALPASGCPYETAVRILA